MDEMDEYRDRIERRQSGRRLKNDRRHYRSEPEQPKFWEPIFVIDMILFIAAGIALYFLRGQ